MSEKFIYAILGPGVSGVGARDLLNSQNIKYLAIGPDNTEQWSPSFLGDDKQSRCIGENDAAIDNYIKELEYLVLSPGIPRSHPLVKKFIKLKKEVINEIDLAFLFDPTGIFVGITGTNGKTTTVTLIDHILKTAGLNSFLGGNIGSSICRYHAEGHKADIYVLELSSFQLETLQKVHFDYSGWINFSMTHEERYLSADKYFEAKSRLITLTKGKENVLLGFSNEVFEKGIEVINESCLNDFSLSQWRLVGEHNIENLKMAVRICQKLGVSNTDIQRAIDNFKGLPYRMQFIGEYRGRKFFNDSKSTNIDSTIKGLSSFNPSEVTLIVGGQVRDPSQVKTEKWNKFFESLGQLIIFGEASNFFRDKVKGENIKFVKSFHEVPSLSRNFLKHIVFSPGFPSFDEFKNYEERGEAFNFLFDKLRLKDR